MPTHAPDPADEPPVSRLGSYGLRAMPCHGLIPDGTVPSSGMSVLPNRMAPAARSRATESASRVAAVLPRNLVPLVVG